MLTGTLKKNHDRTNAKIEVDVYKDTSGDFQLRIYLDGELTYQQEIANWQGNKALWLQSHWGSGVKFSSVDITERP